MYADILNLPAMFQADRHIDLKQLMRQELLVSFLQNCKNWNDFTSRVFLFYT